MTNHAAVDHVLETIDNVLAPHHELPDAMIWSASAPDPTPYLFLDVAQLREAMCLLCDTFMEERHIPTDIHAHNVRYVSATTGWTPQMVDRLWRLIFRGRLRNRYDRGAFSSPRPCPDMADYQRRTRARRKRRR